MEAKQEALEKLIIALNNLSAKKFEVAEKMAIFSNCLLQYRDRKELFEREPNRGSW